MKKALLIMIGLLFAIACMVGIWFVFFWQPGPAYVEVKDLESPHISTLPNEQVMIITTKGNPDETAGDAIGALYKAYMKAGGQWNDDVASRARWDRDLEGVDPSEWVGVFAMPLPEGVTSLPAEIDSRIELGEWKYGKVAEVLHVGSYDAEDPTITKLEEYITKEGYKIIGKHEEVYLKGPNMFGFGSEDKYLTLIRYRVKAK